jgi:3-deoxy-D-manno-octulosonate 8-phosphate phosphatase KdsC-like HAD superfamily phosphatase
MSLENLPPEIVSRAGRVTALVLDVDGVLTDGRIIYAEYGGRR